MSVTILFIPEPMSFTARHYGCCCTNRIHMKIECDVHSLAVRVGREETIAVTTDPDGGGHLYGCPLITGLNVHQALELNARTKTKANRLSRTPSSGRQWWDIDDHENDDFWEANR